MNLTEYRQKYPQLNHIPDDQLITQLHQQYATNQPLEEFKQQFTSEQGYQPKIITAEEYKAKYPQAKDIPDQELADKLHQQYFPNMPKAKFNEQFLGGRTWEDVAKDTSISFGQAGLNLGKAFFGALGIAGVPYAKEVTDGLTLAIDEIQKYKSQQIQAKANGLDKIDEIDGGLLEQVEKTASYLIENPALLADMSAQSVGFLAGGLATSVLTKGSGLAISLYNGLALGGDTYAQTRQQVLSLPEAKLQQSKSYQQYIAEGMDLRQARDKVADDAARQAGSVGMAMGVVTGRFGAGLEQGAEKAVTGKLVSAGMALNGFGKEVMQEGVEGAGQQAIQNTAIKYEADPTQELMQDIGKSMTTEAMAAVPMAGTVSVTNYYAGRNGQLPNSVEQDALESQLEKAEEVGRALASQSHFAERHANAKAEPQKIQSSQIEVDAVTPQTLLGLNDTRLTPKDRAKRYQELEITLRGLDRSGGDVNALKQAHIERLKSALLEKSKKDHAFEQAEQMQAEQTRQQQQAVEAEQAHQQLQDQKAQQLIQSAREQELEQAIAISHLNEQDYIPNNPFAALAPLKQQLAQSENNTKNEKTAQTLPKTPVLPEKTGLENEKTVLNDPLQTALQGKQDQLESEKLGSIPFTYHVVEAEQLTPQMDKAENQARDRNRKDAQLQITQMANNLKPSLLLEAPTMRDGAPVITPDGKIIVGNGRTQALQMAYTNGKAQSYHEALRLKAKKYGLKANDIKKLKHPVLVRKLHDKNHAEELAILSNEEGAAAMSPLEQAAVDAKRIGNITDFEVTEDGKLHPKDLARAGKRLIELTGVSKRGDLLTADGQLSESGKTRVKNAILHKAYGDSTILSNAIESRESGMINLTNALTDIAPQVAKIKDGIQSGDYHDLAIDSDLMQAIQTYQVAKEKGLTTEEYLAQQDAFDTLPDTVKALLPLVEQATRKPNTLKNILQRYHASIQMLGSPKQTGIFGEQLPTKEVLLKNAIQKELDNAPMFNRQNNAHQKSFNQFVEDALTHKNEFVFNLKTPSILVNFGAPELPLRITSSAIRKAIGVKQSQTGRSHAVEKKELKGLISAIENPIAIFETEPKTKKAKQGEFTLITHLKDKEDAPVAVAIHLDRKHQRYDVNLVTSVHGKQESELQLSKWANEGRIKYLDAQRLKRVHRIDLIQFQGLVNPNKNDTMQEKEGQQAQDRESILSSRRLVKPELVSSQVVKKGSSSPIKLIDINARVSAINARLIQNGATDTPIIFTHERVDTLPKAVREQAEREGVGDNFYGTFYNGQVHLLAPNIKTQAQLEAVILHELEGHYGIRKLFGEEAQGKLIQMYNLMGGEEGIRRRLKKFNVQMDEGYFKQADERQKLWGDINAKKTFLVDEFLAHVQAAKATENLPQGIRRRLNEYRQMVVNWLKKMGFTQLAEHLQTTDSLLFDTLKQMSKATTDAPHSYAGKSDGNSKYNAIEDGEQPLFSRTPMKSITENIKRGKQAMHKALTEKTSVHRAMYRNDMGWIDFVWGDEGKVKPNGRTKGGKGIAHILEARMRKDGMDYAQATQFLTEEIPQVIAKGKTISKFEVSGVEKIRLSYDDRSAYFVNRDGGNAWLLTGYEDKGVSGSIGRANELPIDTQQGSTPSRTKLGADTKNNHTQTPEESQPLFSRTPDTNPIAEPIQRNLMGTLKAHFKEMHNSTRKKALALLTNNQIGDLFDPVFERFEQNPVSAFVRETQAFEGDLAKQLREYEYIKRDWDKLSHEESQKLSRLMSESTFYKVDPSKDFDMEAVKEELVKEKAILQNIIKGQKGKAKTRPGDDKGEMMARIREAKQQIVEVNQQLKNLPIRVNTHQVLKDYYNSLTPEAQKLFTTVRDAYARQFDEQVQELINRINRNIADEAVRRQMIEQVHERFKKLSEHEVYFPLARFGDHFVLAEKKDKEGNVTDYMRLHYEKEADAIQTAEQLKKDGWQVTRSTKLNAETQNLMGNVSEFANNVLNMLDKKSNERASGISLRDDIYQLLLQQMPEVSMLKRSIHRKYIKGFSGDQKRAFGHNMFHGAYRIAKIRHSDIMERHIKTIGDEINKPDDQRTIKETDLTKAAAIHDELMLRFQDSMNPQGRAWSAMATQFGFVYFLGASVGSAMVNLTQTPLFTMPYLASKYGFAKANAELAIATKKYLVDGKKTLSLYEPAIDLSKSEQTAVPERKMLKQLIDDGTIETTQTSTLAQLAETNTLDQKSDLNEKTMRTIGYLFHNAEILNRQITALAAYRLAKANGKPHQAAVEAAREAIFNTHFDYSYHNRARFMRGNVAKMLFLFKNYSQQATYLILRSAAKALKGDKEAMKFVAYATLSHLAIAGAAGLPVYTLIGSVAGFMLGLDDDQDWDLEFRKWLTDILKESGSDTPERVTELITHGLFNAYIGVDISNRTSVDLANMWVRADDIGDRTPIRDLMVALTGPLGSLAYKSFDAANTALELGEYNKAAATLMPVKGIRDLIKAYGMMQNGVYSTKTNDYIMTPEEVSTYDITLKALGFTPSELSRRYERKSAIKAIEVKLNQKASTLKTKLYKAYIKGDQQELEKVKEEIDQFNFKYPNFYINIRSSLRSRLKGTATANQGLRINKHNAQYAEKYQLYSDR